jgi:hypothetical protein
MALLSLRGFAKELGVSPSVVVDAVRRGRLTTASVVVTACGPKIGNSDVARNEWEERRGWPRWHRNPEARASKVLPRPCLRCGVRRPSRRGQFCKACASSRRREKAREYAARRHASKPPRPCRQCGLPRPSRCGQQFCRACASSRRREKACECNRTWRQKQPLRSRLLIEQTTARCACGNTFTRWFKRDGSRTSHARKTCGICWASGSVDAPLPRRVKSCRVAKSCRACGDDFLGYPKECYCGVACQRRYAAFLQHLRRRLGINRAGEIPKDVVVMAWAMNGVYRVIQRKELLPKERLPLKPKPSRPGAGVA